MFFIGIFGIEQKEKEYKSFSAVCPECAKFCRAALILSYTYFHFFFFPIFRWNKKYTVVLRCCGCVYDVPEDYVNKLLSSDTIDFSKLINRTQWHALRTCPDCGRILEHGFAYCPYCGTIIK